MASVSKHPADILVWLEKVLESCETHSQLNTFGNLLNLFERQYTKEYNTRHPYYIKFSILCDNRWDKYQTIPNQN